MSGPRPVLPRRETRAPMFRAAAELIAEPRPVEIIEGVASARQLTVVASESGAGKTFVLLAQAAAVSSGVDWYGRSVRQGSVAYLSYEGDALGLRLRALRDVAGHRLEHVYILRASEPLSPIVDRDRVELASHGELTAGRALDALRAELAATGRPPIVLVIIDTVRASLSGSEDSSEAVSAYLRAVRRLMARVPDAAAILAHHAGWQDGEDRRRRERGSSAWRGNCDATLYLETGAYDRERGEARLTLRALKVRDSERPALLHLIRRRVDLLESDARGEPIMSCLIERDRRSPEDREAEQQAAVEAETRAMDLRVLRTIADRPELATSQDQIRLALGIRKAVVVESLGRLVRAGWALPGRRGQPYHATPAGQAALSEGGRE